jgi:hypothetical protein
MQPGASYNTSFMQVIGRVVGANTVEEMTSSPFGEDFGTCRPTHEAHESARVASPFPVCRRL